LTHAHIDHSGYLPRLVKAGYSGPIFCTAPTRELVEILLLDAARLQEEDAEYANRKGFSKHHPALPLFAESDVRQTLKLLRPVGFNEEFEAAGFTCRFHQTGHILGAGFVEVQAGRRLVFSGDLGRFGVPLHVDPAPLPECDTLILESTYGDGLHPSVPLEEQLLRPFEEAIRRRGTILIPAFAVARAQLILLLLSDLMDSGRLPRIPIHIDSPMATDVTRIYLRYEGTGELDVARRELSARGVGFHRSVEESKALNHVPPPLVIISSSGMLTGGRVLHHLRRLLPDSRNLIVLVGYQAAGTRGRSLLDGARTIRMHGQDIPVRARFVQVGALSAHADARDLVAWLGTAPQPPGTAFLVHGEDLALKSLAATLRNKVDQVIIPALNEQFVAVEGDGWAPVRPG
jgi:metallo-beta-lactamase family protein